MSKINLDGIHQRRIMPLISEVKKYFEIYKKEIFEDSDLWSQMFDRPVAEKYARVFQYLLLKIDEIRHMIGDRT